jgi:hypothetical protein
LTVRTVRLKPDAAGPGGASATFVVASAFRRTSSHPSAREILIAASVYAANRLSEVKARSHYVRDLHMGH